MKGKIKKYLSYRGFGFIEQENSEEDIFFHITNFPRTSLPRVGQDIEFEILETQKGKEATNIQVIEKTAEIFTQEEKEEEQPEEPEVDDLDQLNGVGPTYQKLLRASGISSKDKLKEMPSEELYEKLTQVNEEQEITKRPPTLANVEAWINLAKE